MPIVSCKCTNCGANLEVDNTKDAAICKFCGTAFIVEKAINNYNVNNHITAEVVNVYGGQSSDFVIRAGVLEKYNGVSAEVVIPNSVTQIGDGAFMNCIGLKKVVIPNSVTVIGYNAFRNCYSLTDIDIPDSITTIYGAAFLKCGLRHFTISKNVTFISNEVGVSGCQYDLTDRGGMFENCTCLTSVSIADGVTNIGKNFFSNCTGLTSITIPDSVTSIGDNAFLGCTGLTSITFPNSVTSIGRYAFGGCTGLTSITFPNNRTNIGVHAFDGCEGLTNITFPNNRLNIEAYAFTCCNGLTSVTIPDAVIVDKFAFQYCTNLKTVICSSEVMRNCFPWRAQEEEKATLQRQKRPSSGCYIATAVYGSYNCPPVWTLRRYRDHTLAATRRGRAIIRAYYAVSPTLVKWFGHTVWFKWLWRAILDKIVARLKKQGVKDTPYQD